MAAKFGISLSFQIHPGLGEAWHASYRESLELANEGPPSTQRTWVRR